jgi:hypothetical protein
LIQHLDPKLTAHSCLVQFGRSGFVGRFVTSSGHERNARVIVRGTRGVEAGVVLCEPNGRYGADLPIEGELLRRATSADEEALASLGEREAELLGHANDSAQARQLPLSFVDAELMLDRHLILHGLAWEICDATHLFEELSARFQLTVRLLDLSRTPVARDPVPSSGKCGDSGCGSGGCSSCGSGSGATASGCSTGSCSRGAVKSAAELTSYFRTLREQMDAAGPARTPLH